MNTQSQLTKANQTHKPISKVETEKLAQSCGSISDINKKIKTKEIVEIPTPRKLRHSISQRVKGVILALKQKSLVDFIGDDLSVSSSPFLEIKTPDMC